MKWGKCYAYARTYPPVCVCVRVCSLTFLVYKCGNMRKFKVLKPCIVDV